MSLPIFLCVLTVLSTLAVSSHTALADRPSLELPLDCAMGVDCFVQNHFDHVPGEEAADYTCGPLVYDGHDGIDLRAWTMTQMREGVDVLASAPGIVVGVRNSMEDVLIDDIGRDALDGRDAGNGVRIDHGDGWFTQYSHMMKGSVIVAVGDTVNTGQVLGMMGLSGNTQFPHVHLGVSHDGIDIDPFAGIVEAYACGDPIEPLWSPQAMAQLDYVAGGFLQAGFADESADYRAAREGAYNNFAQHENTGALVFWSEFFGLLEGDKIRFELVFPNNFDTITNTVTMDRNRAVQFNFVGRRLPETSWPQGTYEGKVSVLRDINGTEQVIASTVETITYQP